jgi:hypothetical protein
MMNMDQSIQAAQNAAKESLRAKEEREEKVVTK